MPSSAFFYFKNMARTRKYKEALVDSYKNKLKNSKFVFILKPSGVTANESVQLKKELTQLGSSYNIVKNSLFAIALKEEGLPENKNLENLEHAVVFVSEQATEAAKLINTFAKETDKLEIQSGIYEGQLISGDDVVRLAELPSKEVMIAQALSMFNAPLKGFMTVVNANTINLMYALKAVSAKKS